MSGVVLQPMLTRPQAAEYIGVRTGTLAVWASTHRYDLPFVKVGRLVRYRREDLDRWLRSRTQRGEGSQSENGDDGN